MRTSLFNLAIAIMASTTSAFTVSNTPRTTTGALFMSTEAEEETSRRTGVVKWFNTEKGYGFIIPDDGERDIFVHQTAINVQGFRSLADGESVEFETVADPQTGKIKAHDVTGPGRVDVVGAPYTEQEEY